MQYIATFFSHFGALSFSRALKAAGMAAKLMPVPRSLSTSCGTGVSFDGPVELERLDFSEVEKLFCKTSGEYELLRDLSAR